MLPDMDHRMTALEKAFQMARSGEVASNSEIVDSLKRHGYDTGQMQGPALRRQLTALIRAARSGGAAAGRSLHEEASMDEPKSPDAGEDLSKSLERLKEQSADVKAKIEQEKRRHDLPLDSNLGNPDWEESVKDGHLDLPDKDDD